jgi:hypothetical protein
VSAGEITARELAVQLVLRVPSAHDGDAHVEGSIAGPDGVERSFAGWMSLLDVLERLVEDDPGSS